MNTGRSTLEEFDELADDPESDDENPDLKSRVDEVCLAFVARINQRMNDAGLKDIQEVRDVGAGDPG